MERSTVHRCDNNATEDSPDPCVNVQFHDRCAVCTAALATYLGYPASPTLETELKRIENECIYQRQIFFIRNLGFIANTEARRITFEETLQFEKIHEDTYQKFGFELVYIEPASVSERVNRIKALVQCTGIGLMDP